MILQFTLQWNCLISWLHEDGFALKGEVFLIRMQQIESKEVLNSNKTYFEKYTFLYQQTKFYAPKETNDHLSSAFSQNTALTLTVKKHYWNTLTLFFWVENKKHAKKATRSR